MDKMNFPIKPIQLMIVLVFIFFLSASIYSLEFLPGDVNHSGDIDISDALLIAQFYVGLNPSNCDEGLADVNNDGDASIVDAMLVAQYYVGLISEFPDLSVTPDPNPTSSPEVASWSLWHNGYATYTGSGYKGGAALLDPIAEDMEITALNPFQYNFQGIMAAMAGAYLEVKGPLGSTVVYVTDLYPEGADGALDLCPISFKKIGDMALGKIDISWRVIKAPVSGNFQYRIKEGSSQWWSAIQVRNHLYPVLKMEYLHKGQWIEMEKMRYNHFMTTDIGPDQIDIRITDIRGESVVDTLPPMPDGTLDAYLVPGNVQFPE